MLTEWFDLWLSMFLPLRPPPAVARIRGSMIGQCLGDALGFVVEGYSREICLEYVEEVLITEKAGTIGRAPHPFGQYTDDSQLMRELVESATLSVGFEPEDYGRRIAGLFSEQRVVGRGRATTEAAARLANGVPWHIAGVPAPYAGNGAAMRAAPIGWMFPHDDAALVKAACLQARITHTDPRAIAGSVTIAAAVAYALTAKPGRLNAEAMIDYLVKRVRPVEPDFATELDGLKALRLRDPEDAVWLISRAGRTLAETASGRWPEAEGSISPYVVPSVLWSLYSFLAAPDNYMDATGLAISGGGDADTTAAMTGAISGAYLGLEAIPHELAECLTDCGAYGLESLLALADDFCAVRSRFRAPD